MNALRISLCFLLAVTLVFALEKENPPAANDAQPVNAAHAQEDGIKHAVKAPWPFQLFLGRHHATGPNERRTDGGVKDGVRSQKIHRRSRRAYRRYEYNNDSSYSSGSEIGIVAIILIVVFGCIVPIAVSASVGIGLWCSFKKKKEDEAANTGRVIQPAQSPAYPAYPAQPMSQPYSQ